MNTDIQLKSGEVSYYGLMCGYIDRTENDETDQSVTLSAEHGVYHVKLVDFNAPCFSATRGWNAGLEFGCFWLSFDKLSDARKIYRKLASRVNNNWDYLDVVAFEQ